MQSERWYSEPPSDNLIGQYYGGVMMDREELLFNMVKDLQCTVGSYHGINECEHEYYIRELKTLFNFDYDDYEEKKRKQEQEEFAEKRKNMKVETPKPIK